MDVTSFFGETRIARRNYRARGCECHDGEAKGQDVESGSQDGGRGRPAALHHIFPGLSNSIVNDQSSVWLPLSIDLSEYLPQIDLPEIAGTRATAALSARSFFNS
ncbi:uncharacterized protein LOC116850827 [Odontomachus brunneus]|uniref:uncharacterized protein LOC116850827 n=1 Tax=Odontomachus brunneus TaxID=486640 RepID=UPI0013F18A34|nr:uncharacterized protein LOC116850827 [Odontomachus brunneus]